MEQKGFCDVESRYAKLDAKGGPLVTLNALVPWGDFRPRLEAVWRRAAADRKSRAGRKPRDAVVMFKAIMLSALYNLSDEQLEHQLRDRLSFMRAPRPWSRGPDAGRHDDLALPQAAGPCRAGGRAFRAFDAHLKAHGWLAMGGQESVQSSV